MKIILVEGMDKLLPSMSRQASEKALKYLKKFEVDVILNRLVRSYDGHIVELDNGQRIESETLIWAAGVKGNLIQGLPESSIEKGRILVNEYSQVKGFDRIFSIGDVALMKSTDAPEGYPMLAPVAIQQGRHLGKNLKNMLKGLDLKPFKYFDKGTMATVGRNKAVVDLPGQRNFGGLVAWMMWMFVHLVYIIEFRNKLVILSNWIWNYFTYDRGTRLIIRPFIKEKAKK
jgi:NADH dehydrogenase